MNAQELLLILTEDIHHSDRPPFTKDGKAAFAVEWIGDSVMHIVETQTGKRFFLIAVESK